MIELLQYWFISAALLAAAGWCAERVLRHKGREARWVWVTAALLTVVSPLLSRFWTGDAVIAPSGSGVLALPGAEILTAVPAGSGPGFGPAILIAWGLVSLALLAVGAVAIQRLRHEARSWRPATLLGQEVLVSSDFGPAVMGVRRPRIVVPEVLPECSTAELEMMLQHEREHIRGRDPLVLRLAYVLGALLPWNLALLWQVSRLRRSVEEDCDLRVIAGGARPHRYGALLLKMAGRPGPTRPWMAAAAMAEHRSGVARRLRLIRDRSGRSSTTVTALVVIAGATALGVWIGVPSPISFTRDSADLSDFVLADGDVGDPPSANSDFDFDFNFDFKFDFDFDPALAGAEPTFKREVATESSAENGSEPLVYVDGVRVQSGKAGLGKLDPDDIERVEVLKGEAAAALYGEEASAGVIQIYLKEGVKKPGGGG